MKKTINTIIVAGLVSIMILSSCVKDLNTTPLNETDFTSETAYNNESSYLAALAYINGYWALTSQSAPDKADITAPDAGQSELLRQWINLNEMAADSYKCAWTADSYINAIQTQTWGSADNTALNTVYTRAMKGIALSNEYLLQTTDEKIDLRGQGSIKAKVHGYRAEVRFLRALYFYILMDQFGNPPFAMPENIGGELPEQIGRPALFEWIEKECLELTAEGSDMPKKGEIGYPRATQGSVMALLARMYLNAEVYTGTARWQDAKDAAAKVIAMGYTLHDNYQELFMQDNGTNGAQNEFIFAIAYDKDFTESWGGTTNLMSGAMNDSSRYQIAREIGLLDKISVIDNSSKKASVSSEGWGGYHVADDYVARFDLQDVTWDATSGFGYDRSKSDKRAFFFNRGNAKEFDPSTQTTGWFCWKFSGLFSDGTSYRYDGEDQINHFKYSSADFPMFRLAEMYLIYAEADARLNGDYVSDATAKEYIHALRTRAGVDSKTPSDMSIDWLLDERARELMWEGHRRTDLVRYGYYTSMNFPWTYKGGVPNGNVSLPEYRNIYPIIVSDLTANKNLKQNTGY